MGLVQVDAPGSTVLRGLCVPYNEFAFIIGKDGDLFAEIFDEESIPRPPQNIPLLVSHDRDRPPAGMVMSSAVTPRGLGIEARLAGSDDELEGWRRRFGANLMRGLSIGFVAGKPVWEKPPRRGLPPIKRVRQAEILEVSVVNFPAYSGASTLSLNMRTAGEDFDHRESLAVIAAAKATTERVRAFVASKGRKPGSALPKRTPPRP